MQENGALNPTFIPTLKLRLASRPRTRRTPGSSLDTRWDGLPRVTFSTLPAQLSRAGDVRLREALSPTLLRDVLHLR